MQIEQIATWSTETRHEGTPNEYAVECSMFAVTAFGERREVKGSRLSGGKIILEGATVGIRRGVQGTKVWPEGLMASDKNGQIKIIAPQGSHCGHRAANVVGWWDQVPADRRSKR
jgi:hypothetical protein